MRGRLPLSFVFYRRFLRFIRRTRARLQLAPSILVYRGYGTKDRFFLCGRVIQDKGIRTHTDDSTSTNVLNTLKRFASVGVPYTELKVSFRGTHLRVQTDEEGFFSVESDGQHDSTAEGSSMELAELLLPGGGKYAEQRVQAEILVPPPSPPFGLITDIDDTILHTRVRSWFKWRTVYLTLFFNAFTRQHIKDAPDFLRSIHGHSQPVFYVSNSPWNLYDMMLDFLQGQDFPRGPVLLRDLRSRMGASSLMQRHKYICIAHIMNMYKDLTFVLLGDSGEQDPEIYRLIVENFPGRVRAIFIRLVSRKPQTPAANSSVPVIYFHQYKEAEEKARGLGLIQD